MQKKNQCYLRTIFPTKWSASGIICLYKLALICTHYFDCLTYLTNKSKELTTPKIFLILTTILATWFKFIISLHAVLTLIIIPTIKNHWAFQEHTFCMVKAEYIPALSTFSSSYLTFYYIIDDIANQLIANFILCKWVFRILWNGQ